MIETTQSEQIGLGEVVTLNNGWNTFEASHPLTVIKALSPLRESGEDGTPSDTKPLAPYQKNCPFTSALARIPFNSETFITSSFAIQNFLKIQVRFLHSLQNTEH